MKDKHTQVWVPMYVDKWLFGSTRLELEHAERAVFVDLIMMGAKDNGYIRANETIPYPPRQLAAFLNATEELLMSTVTKCLQYGKLEEVSPGMWRISSWDNFKLSKSYKSELVSGKKEVPGGQRTESSQQRTESSPIREEKRIEDKKEYNTTPEGFMEFWKEYPKKVGRGAAIKAWEKLNPPLDKCLATIKWQMHTEQWTKDGGQYIPLPATWLNQSRWQDVPPTHKLMVCPDCGHEGILPKNYTGGVKCGKCNKGE